MCEWTFTVQTHVVQESTVYYYTESRHCMMTRIVKDLIASLSFGIASISLWSQMSAGVLSIISKLQTHSLLCQFPFK